MAPAVVEMVCHLIWVYFLSLNTQSSHEATYSVHSKFSFNTFLTAWKIDSLSIFNISYSLDPFIRIAFSFVTREKEIEIQKARERERASL